MLKLIVALWLCFATNAVAGSLEAFVVAKRNADGSPAEWSVKVKSGTPRLVDASDGGTQAICLHSESSSFSIQRSIELDIVKYPYVTWRWRANTLPPRGDFRHAATDDQAAQMVVAFGSRYAIDYIWDTNAPIDSVGEFSVPFVVTAKILVVANKQNKLQEWVEVTRDLRKDYRRLFGEDPGKITGVRFQVNSQHTGASAEGCISQVTFHD